MYGDRIVGIDGTFAVAAFVRAPRAASSDEGIAVYSCWKQHGHTEKLVLPLSHVGLPSRHAVSC